MRKSQDLTGKFFGKWEVVDATYITNKNNKIKKYWKCKCLCGSISYIMTYSLTHHKSSSCIKCATGYEDLSNRTFNDWTVINLDRIDKGMALWKCKCKCGKIQIIRTHKLKDSNNRGRMCINCRYKKDYVGDISKSVLTLIKQRAKYRKHNFDDNVDQQFLWDLYLKQNGKCALTGLDIYFPKSKISGQDKICGTASLDRIDSSKGYTRDNVQWVNKWINKMKLNHNEEYFIDLCCLVAKNKRGYKNAITD